MPTFRISQQAYDLDADTIEDALAGVLPEPIREHYVVIGGRRYPPKQVLTCATDLDRADFTTHQARRILKRLGFLAARLPDTAPPDMAATAQGPQQGRQAAALAPYAGQWVALAGPTEVLVAAPTPQQVLGWLAKHERRAPYGMFRVPESIEEAEGAAPR
jgi:hypothetical protein